MSQTSNPRLSAAPASRRRRAELLGRPVAAATAFAAAAALLTAVAPAAAADVTSLNIDPGASWGVNSRFGTNCTYTISASINSWQPVSFVDQSGAGAFWPSNYIPPSGGGMVTVQWTPTQPGWHHLIAYQTSAGGPAIDVLVGNGVNSGSACFALP